MMKKKDKKVSLHRVYLLNWYGFVDELVEVRDFTFITGENECGKSTILDAIKYAFLADKNFNKSAETGGRANKKRNTLSYVRCLTNPDTKIYARSKEEYGDVNAYIAMEFYDEINESFLISGCSIEINHADDEKKKWFCAENKTLEDIHFTMERENEKYPLTIKEFSKLNKLNMLDAEEGIRTISTRVGLGFSTQLVKQYRKKLASISTYMPNSNVSKFIKENILEEKQINLNKIIECKKKYDHSKELYESVKKQINCLEEISKMYDKYKSTMYILNKDDCKRTYRDLMNVQEKLKISIKKKEELVSELEILQNEIGSLEINNKENLGELEELKKQQLCFNGAEVLDKINEELNQLELNRDYIQEHVNRLDYIGDTIFHFYELMKFKLDDINTKDFTEADINKIKNKISESKKYLDVQMNDCNKEITKSSEEKIRLIKSLNLCKENKNDFEWTKHSYFLLNEINKEFKNKHINYKAKFACEFVINIRDEEWRNSIEAYLGKNRYSIYVDPKYFSIANKVMDKSNYKYASLINSPLLQNKEFKIVDDSILNQLVIENEIARKYFSLFLGGIRCERLENITNVENSVSKEGKLSKNMSITYLNFGKIKSYCLGSDAIQLNKIRLQNQLTVIENKIKNFESDKIEIQSLLDEHSNVLNKIYEKNLKYNARKDLEAANKEWVTLLDKKEKIVRALNEDNAFFALSNQMEIVEKRIHQNKKDIEKLNKSYGNVNKSLDSVKYEILKNETNEENIQDKIKSNYILFYQEMCDAKKEYDMYVAGEMNHNILSELDRTKIEQVKKDMPLKITKLQVDYSGLAQFPLDTINQKDSIYDIRHFNEKLRELETSKIEQVNRELLNDTKNYQNVFKMEYLVKILTSVRNARMNIKNFNKKLESLDFYTTYQFEVSELNDGSDFSKILKYAKLLEKDDFKNQQRTLFFSQEYDENDEAEFRKLRDNFDEIMNKIMSGNDELLDRYSDYRNYLEYDVLMTNAELDNARLSQCSNYASGAGTQIPYIIILIASLTMLYDERPNCSRLIFMDEPFEKMSNENIKIMLEFFKNQNLQVLFFAPPNKIESIGEFCEQIDVITKSEGCVMRCLNYTYQLENMKNV